MQRRNPLRLLPLAQPIARRHLEERRRRLHQPLGLDGADNMHVLLGRLDERVVHDVLSGLPEQRRRGMHRDGRALDERLVPLGGILARRIAEEARAERLADLDGVAAAGHEGQLVALHELGELDADVLDAEHVAGLDEVLVAPGGGEAGGLPGVVDVEEGDVVAGGVVELGLLLVGLLLLVAGAEEDVLRGGDHGDDGEDFVGAVEGDGGDGRFGEGRVHGEVGHLAAEAGEEAFVVEGAEAVEFFEGGEHGVGWGRVHEVEVEEVVYAHGFEHEDRVGQVLTLDFRDLVGVSVRFD